MTNKINLKQGIKKYYPLGFLFLIIFGFVLIQEAKAKGISVGTASDNIGIGTDTPGTTYRLNVNGNSNITGNLNVTGNITGTSNLTGALSSGNVSAGSFGSNTGGGNYSFPGTLTSSGKLFLDAAEGLGVYGIRGRNSNEQVEMYQKVSIGSPNGWTVFPQAPTFGLSVYGGANFATNQGVVGIGTVTPATGYKLDVRGNLFLSQSSANLRINLDQSGVRGWYIDNTTSGNLAFTSGDGGGGVGIGTVTPKQKLDVIGNVGIGAVASNFSDEGPNIHIWTSDIPIVGYGVGGANPANILIEENDAEQSIAFLGPNSATQKIVFGRTSDSGAGQISFNHNTNQYNITGGPVNVAGTFTAGNMGGANLVPDSTNMAAYNGSLASLTFVDGKTIQALDSPQTGSGSCYQWGQTAMVPVNANNDYEFSIWVKANGIQNVYFGFFVYDSNRNQISSGNLGNPYFHTGSEQTNNGWVKITAHLRSSATPHDSGYVASVTSNKSGPSVSDYVMPTNTSYSMIRFGSCYGGTGTTGRVYMYNPVIREVSTLYDSNYGSIWSKFNGNDYNVGIGTADPGAYRLNVNGSINATTITGAMSSTLNAANLSAGTFGANTGGGNYTFPGKLYVGGTTDGLYAINGRGNYNSLLIDNNSGDFKGVYIRHLDGAGSGGCGGDGCYGFKFDDQRNNNYSASGYSPSFIIQRSGAFAQSNLFEVNPHGTLGLVVADSGNVGIGKAASDQKLDVAGNIAMNGKTALYGYDSWLRINEGSLFSSGIYAGSGTMRTDGRFEVGGSGSRFVVDGNNVGIGTTGPSARLDVRGNTTVGDVLNLGNLTSVSTSAYRGITWESNFSDGNYAIYKPAGGWTQPLNIAFYTGIHIGAEAGYGGTKFYNNPNMASELMSVGNGDANVRITNTLFTGRVQASAGSNFNGNGYSFNGGGDTDGGMFSPADGTLVFATNNTEKMRIMPDGSVGIGVTPGYKLDVAGDIRARGNVYTNANYGYGLVGTYDSTKYQGIFTMGYQWGLPADGSSTGNLYGLAWSHPNAGGVASNLNTHGLLVMENGTFLAAISGSIRARDDMQAPIFYDRNNTGYYVDPNGTSNMNYINGTISNASKVNGIDSNPNNSHPGTGMRPFYSWNTGQANNASAGYSNGISIGSHPGDQSYGFQIVQNMWDDNLYFRRYNAGWQTWYSVVYKDASNNSTIGGTMTAAGFIYNSDVKLKKNIATIESPLTKILQLRGVTFNWKKDNTPGVGLIAQEVEKVFPELVSESNGIKSVQYGNLVAPLIEAVKEQQTEIQNQQNQINEMKAQIQILQAKN